jgi:ankyrin repeat protein
VLHTAVQAGHLESVEILLQHHFDPDAFDLDGLPASHIAAARGRADLIELLLSYGAAVDARDFWLQTTLGAALEAGQMDTLHLLLNRGADLSARDYQNRSLLQAASLSGKPAIFFALVDAGLSVSFENILSSYRMGQRQIWTTRGHMERLAITPEIFITRGKTAEVKAVLNLVPPHCRKLNLTCRVRNDRISVLYRDSTLGDLESVVLFHNAGAMLNLEGGAEGTPLMGACKAGRLEVVKYLVRNGAILNYGRNGFQVSAFLKAASYPKIQRWLLVERFTDQRIILDGQTSELTADMENDDTWTDEIADVTLDLVLEDDVEIYLESKNWFLPMRRFIDDGRGACFHVPIMPDEFARYRPRDFKVSSK